VLQALYFSTVASIIVGFGDIHSLNSTGVAGDGSRLPVNPWGLLLVIAQLTLAVLFLLVFVNIFLGRSLNPDNKQNNRAIPQQRGRLE
jgi:hypothetical protein